MKTVVLDDDPTGTQSASAVRVLLRWDAGVLAQALRRSDSVYLQTNSRAINRADAIALMDTIVLQVEEAERRLDARIRVVLRGDSTLRGHVFAETERFLGVGAAMVFCPAFPAGGRTTEGGVHYVQLAGERLPASATEYATDPVFPFHTSVLTEYVRQMSGRTASSVPLAEVRGPAAALAGRFAAAEPGSVLIPDAVTDQDVHRVAQAVEAAEARGTSLTVRSAAPLAADLAGVTSTGLLEPPLVREHHPTLVVCGSHTDGATQQLQHLQACGVPVFLLSTASSDDSPEQEAKRLTAEASAALRSHDTVAIATERHRRPEHGTLEHGEGVMNALMLAARHLLPQVGNVVAKGGITSAELARTAIGAQQAWVKGQIAPGVSVWDIERPTGGDLVYVIVPGNVGGPETIVNVLHALS